MPHPTSFDPNSVRWHLAKLDSLRGRKSLREGEKRCILRVFYDLKEEKHEGLSSSGRSTDARARTARLFSRAQCTAGGIVASWIKAHRSVTAIENRECVSVLNPRQSGNTNPKPKRIPDDPEFLKQVRAFVQSKHQIESD